MRTRLRLDPLEARLTPAAGSLDPTFGRDPVFSTAGVMRTNNGIVTTLEYAPDGDVFALVFDGTVNAVQRINPDGTLDPAFDGDGVAPLTLPTGFGAARLAALPGGGVLVGGFGHDAAGTPIYDVVRLTAAGAIDPTFGTNGAAVVPLPLTNDSGILTDIAVQPDGGILLVGDQTPDRLIAGQPPRYYTIYAARLTPGGAADSTFGTNGLAAVADPTGGFTSLVAGGLALQPDGRIVVAGGGSRTARGERPQLYSPVAVRLAANGSLDPTFGAGGFATPAFAVGSARTEFEDARPAVAVLADGRVVLAGPVRPDANTLAAGAARLTAAGQPDPTYGTAGLSVTTLESNGTSAASIAVDAAGRAVFNVTYIAGTATPTLSVVLRLAPLGAPDAGFGGNGSGGNGRVYPEYVPGLSSYGPGAVNVQPGLALLPNGDIMLGGTDRRGENPPVTGVVVRLLGNNPAAGFVGPSPGTFTAGGAADGSFTVMSRINVRYTAAGVTAAFPGFAGSVRTATADVTGDGTPDYVVGAGPGGPPQILVIDGATGLPAANFAAFEAGFTGGVFVAAADLDRDGKAEVIVTPDQGGGPRVLVFSVAPGGGTVTRASFFGIDDPNFRGGARAALGDIDRDGVPDLVVAAGFLGGPRVAVFGGASLFTSPTRLVSDFFAFPGTDAATLRNGAFVAVGDVTGDGFADLVFGGGPGGGPRVLVLSGATVLAGNVAGAQAAPVANYFVAGDSTDRGGIRVAVADADGDARADVVTGSGAGRPARVRVYRATGFGVAGEPAADEFAPFGGTTLPDGVYVG